MEAYDRTEDKRFVDVFKNVFKDSLITIPRNYMNFDINNKKPITVYRGDRDNDIFLTTLEYMTEMVILSTLDNIVAGRASGISAVNMMTNGFKNKYYFFLGRYGVVGDA